VLENIILQNKKIDKYIFSLIKINNLMEHLHKLVNGIDNLKEHLTDNEYLELMTSISKLNEIISSYNDDSSNDAYDEEEEYEEEYESDTEEEEIDIDIVNVDLLLETIKNNEIVFNDYKNNLSDDLRDEFIKSQFNVITQTAYNYITNKTCNCKDGKEICNNIYDLYNCKNYQHLILQCPIVHLIVKNNCPCCVDTIIEDIKKYNMFQLDGQLKLKNIEENIFANTMLSLMNLIPQIFDNKYQIILFLGIYNYVFNYSNILITNVSFKEVVLNKLQTNSKKESTIEHVPFWASIFNFDKNIINIMIDNLEILK
jgi:hypothetical protein